MPKRRRRRRKPYLILSECALYHLETLLMTLIAVELYLFLAQG